MGVAEDFGVEGVFVAKVVVDGCDISAGAGGDFADGGVAEAEIGEGLACGFDEALAGGVVGGGGGGMGPQTSVSMHRLKRLFENVKNYCWIVFCETIGSHCK